MALSELKQETTEMSFFTPPPVLSGFHGERECRSTDPEQKNHMKEHHDGGSLGSNSVQQQKLCARGHWRPAEDATLKELVTQYGPQNWNLIAEKLDGRSGKSCRLRWFNQLDPRINRKAFSEEEEERLLAAHKLYGNKWALIARLFPGRTDNAVKNHWHVIMARKHRQQSNEYRRRKPSHNMEVVVMMNMSRNNACSGDQSTITTTRDHEIASTAATDLSLNSSLTSRSVVANNFLHNAHLSDHSTFNGTGSYEKIGHGGPMMLADHGFDQYCANSDSSSEVFTAATEPKAYQMRRRRRSNAWMHDGSDYGKDSNIGLPFIDFLGVGAT